MRIKYSDYGMLQFMIISKDIHEFPGVVPLPPVQYQLKNRQLKVQICANNQGAVFVRFFMPQPKTIKFTSH